MARDELCISDFTVITCVYTRPQVEIALDAGLSPTDTRGANDHYEERLALPKSLPKNMFKVTVNTTKRYFCLYDFTV